jgi:hypothetical protein
MKSIDPCEKLGPSIHVSFGHGWDLERVSPTSSTTSVPKILELQELPEKSKFIVAILVSKNWG